MILKEVVLQALDALVHHRFRAAMTMLGISWGIVTVVLLMAYGDGFHRALMYGFRGAFTDGTVIVWGGQTSQQAGGERSGKLIRLKPEDAEALLEAPLVKYVSPEFMQGLQPLAWGNRTTSSGVRSVHADYGIMRSEIPETGRFLNAEDVDKHRRVAFVGAEVARRLFGNVPAVGETLRIRGVPFEVIGVGTNKVQISNYGVGPDKYCVFIPYTTAGQLWDTTYVSNLVFQTVDPRFQEAAIQQVREILAVRKVFVPRDERALRINDTVENTRSVTGITDGLKVVLTFIGTLTLTIGGIGVMNIMLVSVTERTREIGIRKAIGARRRDLILQFMLEALVITFVGGALGVLMSYAVIGIVGPRPFLAEMMDDPTGNTDIHLLLSPNVMLTAAGILVVVGLIAGLWPAIRASRMDPIESLRYE